MDEIGIKNPFRVTEGEKAYIICTLFNRTDEVASFEIGNLKEGGPKFLDLVNVLPQEEQPAKFDEQYKLIYFYIEFPLSNSRDGPLAVELDLTQLTFAKVKPRPFVT